MATFDAGKIEATLDLDRTPFQRGMAMARREAAAWEGHTFTANLDLDTANVRRELAIIRRQVRQWDGSTYSANLDVNTAGARAELAQMNSARAGIMALYTGIGVLATGGIPLLAAATGGIVALAGAAVSAGAVGGAGIAAIVAQLKLLPETNPFVQEVKESLEGLKEAGTQFAEDTAKYTLPVLADLMDVGAKLLPKLEPLVKVFGDITGQWVKDLDGFLESPKFDSWLTWMEDAGGRNFDALGNSIGNLFAGLMDLMIAFQPVTDALMGWLEGITGQFADWAENLDSNSGFQKLLDYILEVSPKVGAFFSALWEVLVGITVALAPIGEAVMAGLTSLLDSIGKMDPSTIQAVSLAIVGLIMAFSFAGPIATIIAAITAIGPWGLLAGAIALVVGGLITLMGGWDDVARVAKTTLDGAKAAFEDFMDGISEAAGRFMGAIGGLVGTIKGIVEEVIGSINIEALMGQAKTLWDQIATTVSQGLDTVSAAIENISTVVSGIWEVIGDDVLNFVDFLEATVIPTLEDLFGMLEGWWEVLEGLFTGDGKKIKKGFEKIWDGLDNILRRAFREVRRLIEDEMDIWSNKFKKFGKDLPGDLAEAAERAGGRFIRALAQAPAKIQDVANDMIMAAVRGVIAGVPDMLRAGMRAGMAVVNAIATFPGRMLALGLRLIGRFAAGVLSGLGVTRANAMAIAMSIITTFISLPGRMFSIGVNIMSSLASGIAAAVGNVLTTIANAVSAIGNALGSIPTGIGSNATGTDYWRGGRTIVGESGPEEVYLPRGAKVRNAHSTRRSGSGKRNLTVVVNQYNPVAEKSSVANQRAMMRLAALGVLG